jgi:hypothetical protein
MRIIPKVLIVLLLSLSFTISLSLVTITSKPTVDETEVKAIQADIMNEYQFDNVLWVDAKLVTRLDNNVPLYITTCLVEGDELIEYRFAATIENESVFDVDTWLIKYIT